METLKTIYQFVVNVPNKETNEIKSYQFAVKRPSRSEKDEAGLVQSKYYNDYIRAGVVPEAILSKVYKNQGGVLDEEQKMLLVLSEFKLRQKREEFKLASVNEKDNKELLEKLSREIIETQKEVTNVYYNETSFYQETAEFKAKNKLIQYYFGILLYWKPKEDSEWARYFNTDNVEEVLDRAEELEDADDEIFKKARDKAIFAISYAVSNGFSVKSDEIKESAVSNGYGD